MAKSKTTEAKTTKQDASTKKKATDKAAVNQENILSGKRTRKIVSYGETVGVTKKKATSTGEKKSGRKAKGKKAAAEEKEEAK